MMTPQRLLLVIFLCFNATVSSAQTITLKSTTDAVELTGQLTDYKNGFYIVETDLGELEVDARTVTCIGSNCPETEDIASKFILAGSRDLIDQLFMSLLENYSHSIGTTLDINVTSPNTAKLNVIGTDERVYANIDVIADGNDVPSEALVVKYQTEENLIGDPQSHPFAADALVAITSLDNPIDSISLNALAMVLNGTITNWKGIGGPDVPINLYIPNLNSDLANISKRLGYSLTTTPIAIEFDDLEELSTAVSNDPFSIGFVNFANANNTKALAIKNDCGIYVQPNPFNIQSGAYPSVFYYSAQTPSKNIPIFMREFLEYLQNAQAHEVMKKLGYTNFSVSEKSYNNQGNRIIYGLISTTKSVPVSETRTMLTTLNGARQLSSVLRFAQDGFDLDARSTVALESFVSELLLGNYADQELIIVGYTSSLGSTGDNKRKSKAAAQIISKYIQNADSSGLLSNLQIKVVGFGEASPISCDNNALGQAINNRVEIWVKDKN